MTKINFKKQFSTLTDQWGGIDKHVFDFVVTLNELGFETLASCEGHIDHGHPTPRIVIRTIPKDAKPGAKLTARKEVMTKLKKLINAFYKGHKAGEEKIVLIQEQNRGTIVLIAGLKYYRHSIRRIVRLNRLAKLGRKSELIITKNELALRKQLVPKLQREIIDFGKFLKKFRK